MATFVVAHGAWSAGFVWKKMRPLLKAHGHDLWAPSYTGLGDRVHLANPAIDLETHIEDLVSLLFHEDLRDVCLIGHSYGGIAATGVADRAGDRLSQLIYLDAFIPRDGQSMFDLAIPAQRQRWLESAQTDGDGWRVSPNPLPPDTSAADAEWILPRRHDQPLKSMTQPLRLENAAPKLPRSFIYCTRTGPGDMFGPYAQRARSDTAWRYVEMDASHSPHVTVPVELAGILHAIVTAPPGPLGAIA